MLLATLLALAAQDATLASPETKADGTQSWSILVPNCPAPSEGQILVCGKSEPPPQGPPDRPMPSNRDLSGTGALAATSSPCATLSQGCTTGVDLFGMGTFALRAVGKLVDPNSCCEEQGEATNPVMLLRDVVRAAKRVGRKKPDKSNRVPIPMEDPVAEEKAPATVP